MSIRSKITDALDGLTARGGVLPSPKRGDNIEPYLADIYVAQEVKKWAEDRLKRAWARAQDDKDGVAPSDDQLRKTGKGEEIIIESGHFSMTVKVDTPRQSFDRKAFVAQVAKRYKLPLDKLDALADECVVKTAPPLTKRVLEA